MSSSLPDPTDHHRVEHRAEHDSVGADPAPLDATPAARETSSTNDVSQQEDRGRIGDVMEGATAPADDATERHLADDGTPHERPAAPMTTSAHDAPASTAAKNGVLDDDADDPDEDEDDGPSRTAKQWWPYLISVLAFLVAPYVVGVTLPAATATTAMLVLLPVAAFGTGLLDGMVFRSTWSFPILTGLICWFALKLYSDPGTWIYAVGVFLLCLAGSHLGGRRNSDTEDRRADGDDAHPTAEV